MNTQITFEQENGPIVGHNSFSGPVEEPELVLVAGSRRTSPTLNLSTVGGIPGTWQESVR